MKAKEYAEHYQGDPGTDALIAIANAFAVEVKSIAEQRHATSDGALIAILDEQDRKWRAFARIVGAEVREDGFEGYIRITMPTVYARWQR